MKVKLTKHIKFTKCIKKKLKINPDDFLKTDEETQEETQEETHPLMKEIDIYNLLNDMLENIKNKLIQFEKQTEEINEEFINNVKFTIKSLIKNIREHLTDIDLKKLYNQHINDKKTNLKDVINSLEKEINKSLLKKDDLELIVSEYINKKDYKQIVNIFDNIAYIKKENKRQVILDVIKNKNKIKEFINQVNLKKNNKEIIQYFIETDNYEYLNEYYKKLDKIDDTDILLLSKYNMEKKKTDISNKIYKLIKNKVNKDINFINNNHKKFCEKSDLFDIPDIYEENITNYKLYVPYFVNLFDKFTNSSTIKNINDNNYYEKSFVNIIKKTNNYNFEILKKYLNYNLNIDLKWYKKMLKYLHGISLYDKYTVTSYTIDFGFRLINNYLIGNNTINDFNIIIDRIRYMDSKKFKLLEENDYEILIIPFFPQIMKFLKINNYIEMIKILNTFEDRDIISLYLQITPIIINDIKRIINNSPPLSGPLTLYRRVYNIYYPLKGDFKTQTFTSTSLSFDLVDNIFTSYPKNIMKFILKKGDKCLFTEPLTVHRGECEFLININNEFNIKKSSMKIPIYIQNMVSKQEKSLEDILCNFSVKEANITTFISK